ncbi:glycine--tRNA ligase subunit beta [Candidatus Rhabdochlamydia porcellionis]|uniref:Glycine--tRNA ligase beta subunit n=1 Tax=Candidatus Rhabdochlamydia porcellionis TaxID=225148 RepID=A0ABX8Z0D7_9BACT|nr:glycine--tRNA ligase subunit beta [Candidatus Rhabdochlamydia porcellionis]QZA59097.1 Glycyl-tRNA synthetase beta subunit [Candidatus Rhabdochlamydia porcellionis]
MLTFEQIIERLNTFWIKQNCIIHQGYDLEVGAGIFNPAIFLRCLGKEPHRAAYVESCRRPKNARDLNRLQMSHQYQVIIKPPPTDTRTLYLQSLFALNLDIKKYDIRFVHNDWEISSLGISGLGWKVWCNGMEITQFTYLQTVGDIALKPISVEITYDLEKLALFLQNKTAIFDIQYNHLFTFRDLFLQNEVEWSHYHLTEASVPMWLRHFSDYEQEIKNLVKNNLPIPAYDFVIKASHAFNLLDARGAICFAQRNHYIRKIRDLTHLVAKAILSKQTCLSPSLISTKFITQKNPCFNPKNTRDLLLEIGSEQLPASFVPIGCLYLENAMRNLLETSGLEFEELQIFGTPQRLSILVKNLVEGTESVEEQIKGPSITVAFDKKGNLTKEGKGFLQTCNIAFCTLTEVLQEEIQNLYFIPMGGVQYLIATVYVKGSSTYALLQKKLPSLIMNIDFPKKMYWEDPSIRYARPIRWILALFGTQVVPFNLGRIQSGNFSFGHFQLSPTYIEIKHPKYYLSNLKNHYVLADIEERKQHIKKQIKTLEQQIKGCVIEQNKILPEVLHLTEWPTLMLGFFDAKFLKIPQEILISQIIKHLKYFPVTDRHDQLMNAFIITIDNQPNSMIQLGNEKELLFYLSNRAILYEKEVHIPLELSYYKLQEIRYQKNCKNLWDKVERLILIATIFHQYLKVAEYTHVQRAALLSKSDLCSALVNEFPDLQGIIGKYYALAQNEQHQVAIALEEQWMPRSKWDAAPKTPTGIILSLSDKIDDLISFYSTSKDLYPLRKQATGIIQILLKNKMSCNLQILLLKACQAFPITNKKKATRAIISFINTRKKLIFEELGFKKDEIDAITRINPYDPFDQLCRLKAFCSFRKAKKSFSCFVKIYKRIKGYTQNDSPTFQQKLMIEPAERKILQEYIQIHNRWPKLLQQKQYLEAFKLLAELQNPLERFFKAIIIFTDDLVLRGNRIALLKKLIKLFESLMDFSKF